MIWENIQKVKNSLEIVEKQIKISVRLQLPKRPHGVSVSPESWISLNEHIVSGIITIKGCFEDKQSRSIVSQEHFGAHVGLKTRSLSLAATSQCCRSAKQRTDSEIWAAYRLAPHSYLKNTLTVELKFQQLPPKRWKRHSLFYFILPSAICFLFPPSSSASVSEVPAGCQRCQLCLRLYSFQSKYINFIYPEDVSPDLTLILDYSLHFILLCPYFYARKELNIFSLCLCGSDFLPQRKNMHINSIGTGAWVGADRRARCTNICWSRQSDGRVLKGTEPRVKPIKRESSMGKMTGTIVPNIAHPTTIGLW